MRIWKKAGKKWQDFKNVNFRGAYVHAGKEQHKRVDAGLAPQLPPGPVHSLQ